MANGKAKTRNAKKHLREETKMEIVHDYYLGTMALPYTEAKGEQKFSKRGAKPIGIF